jgi:predicted naringenin-chalcone synthase
MYLASLAHALPERSWTQADCWEALKISPFAKTLRRRSMEILERVLTGDSGIETRGFCTERLDRLISRSAEELNRDFEREAPRLGVRALQDALAKSNVPDVDALFVCTCTGYLCPGLSSYIAEQCGLKPDAYLMDMTGAGCGAAIPTLRAASHYLAAHPRHRVAVLAVEVCSAAFYLNDDPGVLISLCLFGDGASAAILDAKGPGRRFSDFRSLHRPDQREKIRFVNSEGKLRNKLHRSVPEVAAEAVASLYPAANGHVPYVVSHAGGRDVLTAVRERLPGHELVEAAEVLRQCGNLSSPSVLIALEKALAKNGSAPDKIWLTSFGAGFACHACSLET